MEAAAAGEDPEDTPLRTSSRSGSFSLKRQSTAYFPPPESVLVGLEEGDDNTFRSDPGAASDSDEPPEVNEGAPQQVGSVESVSVTGKGQVWHVKVMTDDYGPVKAKRPIPTIKVSELYESLQRINGRWIFSTEGGINAWPALVNLELRSLTVASGGRGMLGLGLIPNKKVQRLWDAGSGPEAPDLPAKDKIPKRTRATFVAADWSSVGWAEDSPGFVWWYSRHINTTSFLGFGASTDPVLRFGEKMIEDLQQGDKASAYLTKAYAFAHRYPVAKETFKDQQTVHAAVLVEWSHGMYTTILELAYLNGCSGYNGRSNWCEDKLETPTQLDLAMPASMKVPWDIHKSEVRMWDMPFKNVDELMLYLKKYSSEGDVPPEQRRFVDPTIYDSADVRLRNCTPAQLAGYIINYIHRAARYIEWQPDGASNCQTFAADLFSFLTGSKNSKPYGKIIQSVYKQRSFSFLYRPGN